MPGRSTRRGRERRLATGAPRRTLSRRARLTGGERVGRHCIRLAMVVGTVAAAVFAMSAPGSTATGPRNGGIFRISYAIGSGIDYLDPALAYTAPAWALLDTTCLRLMSYPDKPSPGSFRLVPEAATGPPKVSRDGRTYTFTVRKGLRFSDGRPVRASAFARAINRVLAPQMRSPWATQLVDLEGASDVRAGRAASASGVTARGNTLTLRFVRPPAAVESRTAMPYMCAVPPALAVDPEGRAEIPAAGPYYVAEYRPDERIVIRRNRFYGGNRPHHVDRFDVDLRAASPRDMVMRIDQERGRLGTPGRAVVLRRVAWPAVPEIRDQPRALLRQAGLHPQAARVQRLEAALPGQPRATARGEFRARQVLPRRRFRSRCEPTSTSRTRCPDSPTPTSTR